MPRILYLPLKISILDLKLPVYTLLILKLLSLNLLKIIIIGLLLLLLLT